AGGTSAQGAGRVGAFLGITGVAVVALALGDAIATTVRVGRRGGPVTRLVSGLLWRGLSRLRVSRLRLFPLYVSGMAVTLSIIGLWIAATIFGWFLIFASTPGAILETATNRPADMASRLYYSGYTVFTLGIGDYRPGGTVWQTATWFAAGSGLLLVTLVITYTIPLTTAVSQKRQLARLISGLGSHAAEIVAKGWSGRNFSVLEGWLQSLTPLLARLAEHHLAYPMLHFFHTGDRDAAVGPAVAVLDETLLVLELAVDPDVRPSRLSLDPPRAAIEALLTTIPEVYVNTASEPPPHPGLGLLEEHGIPCVPRSAVRDAFDEVVDERRRLLSLVHHEGWTWEAVDHLPEEAERPEPPVLRRGGR
ncbi:MAG TPA: ion channel, partial [Nitriliruptorales bacterium]|nr:ion channel [Nitriliruptorales bacterium]